MYLTGPGVAPINIHIGRRPSVAVIGTGISGLSAAWLLAPYVNLMIFEAAHRVGGHCNTVDVDLPDASLAVDTGFIVYNELTYPNFTALIQHLDVETCSTDMSFSASLDGGALEYSGASLRGLFAQKRNLVSPRFWSMIYDLQRFYRLAPATAHEPEHAQHTLGEFISAQKFGAAFVEQHLLPLSAAIWSAKPAEILDYPVSAFVKFHENHGLLKLTGRPVWRTIVGGSRSYVQRMVKGCGGNIQLNCRIASVQPGFDGIEVVEENGKVSRFDHVILATHADQSLSMIARPTPLARELLSSFRYNRNEAWLHSDPRYMPNRRSVWASWNFVGDLGGLDRESPLVVSYWMNQLQQLKTRRDLFVTLNPATQPREDLTHKVEHYEHPIFDQRAITAQRRLWSLQGEGGLWFCGAYFGSGFHEDGLQAGLAVAEQIGREEGIPGVRRPWQLTNESDRICVPSSGTLKATGDAA